MKFIPFSCFFILLFLAACAGEPKDRPKINSTKTNVESTKVQTAAKEKPEEKRPERQGLEKLVAVRSLDSSILVDLKYAGSDNFMRKRLYYDLHDLYLQADIAARLVKVQAQLKKIRPDLTLLLYDGVRPLSVQWAMWKALDSIPVKDRVKFVSNPASGSIHNYGAAIDLTIADLHGNPLDMGAGYDDIRLIAYPKLEAQFLASGELSEAQVNNRKLLRRVMASQGFTNIPTEWWHFNGCSRVNAKKRYEVLQ